MGTVSLATFYRSDEWLNFRRVLMMERRDDRGVLLCEHCGRPIVKAYDCVAHHVIELTEQNVNDPMIALNPEYVLLVHFKCHNDIHKRFGCEAGKRVYYVHGSPLAGKTSFVREAASPNDLVVDMDAIYSAISVNPLHYNAPRLKINAFEVRNCLLDQIKHRTGKWQSAWIIATEALATQRARTIEQLGAEEIHINTDMQMCLDRAAERPNAKDARQWVQDYFGRYTE